MQLIVKRYLLRASLLAGLSIFLGIALSILVYVANEKVKENAIDVVENRIPILEAVNELIADLSEQERIVYEYYRSTDSTVFLESSDKIQRVFAMHLTALKEQPLLSEYTASIEGKQQEIIDLFDEFHRLMLSEESNWDEMRAVLRQITDKRTALMPTLKSVERLTTQVVEEGHENTLIHMNETRLLVMLYGGFIVLIAGIVSWYIRQYIITQAKSTRLALFSMRNPNPILSVNNLGEVVFANPACGKLLECVGINASEVNKLLPDNFLSLRQQIVNENNHSLVLEQKLLERILQISIYWHQELDAYDIHIKDITERVKAEEEVKQLAFTSQSTQLPNSHTLDEYLSRLIGEEKPFALGVIAIRQYNEKVATLGGEVVASLVRCFAKVLAKQLPNYFQLFHISDSEFAVVQAGSINPLDMQQLATGLAQQGDKALVTRFGEFFIECDLGFVLYPEHATDPDTLIKNAHIALSVVHQQEHENYSVFNPRYALEAEKRATLIDKLRNAIVLDELFLVFQPQMSLRDNTINGVETLVRWRHNGDIVSPADFIPLTEQSGLIVPIGKWILEQACLTAMELIQQGQSNMVVAVNVSPRQFSHPQFIETVKNALMTTGLPPENLELEITEGVFMHNETSTIGVMHQLKALGVQLSIDDFGTGYSSLSYLKQFPVDKLKIDQSFVRECHENDQDKAIISTIIGLGKNLNLSLIAEGVEEVQHVSLLRGLQCEEIQGYWFSRPLEKQALFDFINQHEPNNNALTGNIKECS